MALKNVPKTVDEAFILGTTNEAGERIPGLRENMNNMMAGF